MMKRILRWLRDPQRRRDENGNSLILFVFLLPLIVGAFGAGVDLARNTYIRESLQNSLDMATVGGAAAAQPDATNHVNLTTEANQHLVVGTVDRLYALNRRNGPGLQCTGPGTPIAGTSLTKCWQTVTITFTANTVTYTVHERSKNGFLGVLGMPYQDYTLVSHGAVSQSGR